MFLSFAAEMNRFPSRDSSTGLGCVKNYVYAMLHGHKVSFSLVTRLYLTEIAFSIPFVHPCRAESQPSQQQPLRSRCHIVTNVIDRNFIETSPAECYTRSCLRWTASNDQKPGLSSSKSGRISVYTYRYPPNIGYTSILTHFYYT